MSLLTLGVETSGSAGAVALRRNGTTVESVWLPSAGQRHAQSLASEIDALLRRTGVSPRQLELVAVSIGPGSFTGLRVGVVFAKTLAYAIGCRLTAVDTFQAIASACPADIPEVFVVGDAQRGDLFVGRYARDIVSRVFVRCEEITIESVAAFCQRLNRRADHGKLCSVTGPGVGLVQSRAPTLAHWLGPEFHHPRAEVVAALGEQRALAGGFSDPWLLEPFYLRRSAAEEKSAAKPSGEGLQWQPPFQPTILPP